jgi:signal transduction histidine kinase
LKRPSPDRPGSLYRLSEVLSRTSAVLAVLVVALGLVVLAGFVVRSAAVVRLRPGLPPMYPNAAIGFVAGGGALLAARLRRTAAVRVAATGAAVTGVIGAVGLALNIAMVGRTWYDAIWPHDPFVAATTPVGGRPAAETCVAFMFLGAALWMLAWHRAPRAMQGCSLAAAAIGFAALIGYAIGVDRADTGRSFVTVGMALHTAIGISALAVAAFVSRPREGLVGVLTSGGLVGRLSRRMMLLLFAAPFLLAAVSELLLRTVDESLAQSILSVVQVAFIGVIVLIPAAAIEDLDRVAVDARRAVRRAEETLAVRDELIAQLTAELRSPVPEIDGWEIAIEQEPAVGELPADTSAVMGDGSSALIAVIDVAGHGPGPALDAFRLSVELDVMHAERALPAVAGRLNDAVIRLHTTASAFIGRVDLSTGSLTYLNAGHPPAIQVRAGEVTTLGPTGPIFGLPGRVAAVAQAVLDPGDLLVVYTDGLSEARDPATGSLLGDDGIRALVRASSRESAALVARVCVDRAREQSQGRLDDDALALALRRR